MATQEEVITRINSQNDPDYDQQQQVFLTMLADTGLMEKPWEQNYKEFVGTKGRLDSVRLSLC